MAEDSINMMLDDHCLLEIFSYLTVYDMIHIYKVCERWDKLTANFWKTDMKLYCIDNNKWRVSRGNGYHSSEYILPNAQSAISILKHISPFIQFCDVSREYEPIVNRYRHQVCFLMFIYHPGNLSEAFILIPKLLSALSVDSLLNNCINLEKLSFTNMNLDMENDLGLFFSRNKRIKSISLHGVQLSCHVSTTIYDYFPTDLEKIYISRCLQLAPCFLIFVLQKTNCLRLFSSDFSNGPHDSLAKIIGDQQTLNSLSLTKSYKFPISFDYVANLVNLSELILIDNDKLQDESLIMIFNNCKQLQKLVIKNCDEITDRGIMEISTLPKLEILSIASKNITDIPIGKFPNTLKDFSCYDCENVKDYGVITLINRTPNLHTLELVGCCGITDRLIESAIETTEGRKDHHLYIKVHGCNVKKILETYGQRVAKLSTFLTVSYFQTPTTSTTQVKL